MQALQKRSTIYLLIQSTYHVPLFDISVLWQKKIKWLRNNDDALLLIGDISIFSKQKKIGGGAAELSNNF